jgi:hypothetical protein
MAPTHALETATISSDYSDDEEDGAYSCNTGFTTVKMSNVSDEGRRNKKVSIVLFSSVKPSVSVSLSVDRLLGHTATNDKRDLTYFSRKRRQLQL